MLHAPTSDTKQQADLARANAPAQDLSRSKAPPLSPQRQRTAQWQYALGNQATLRMLSLSRPAVQAKLTINTPGDAYEQEADRVADQVMRMSDADLAVSRAPAQVSRKCAACEEEDKKKLQMKSAGGGGLAAAEAPPIVHEVLREPGQPLDAATRAFFEPRFGHDFGRVRVHTDALARESAGAVNALAYTFGDHVVSTEGQHVPATHSGRRLLAHELAHVLQQTPSAPPRLAPPGAAASQAQSLSREIDAGTPNTGALQRQTAPNATAAPPARWSSDMIGCSTAVLDENKNWCSGSGCAPPCSSKPLNVRFLFTVDMNNAPRPQPFDPPNLSATAFFYPTVGDPDVLIKETSKGVYTQPGAPLQTSFPPDLTFFTPDSPGTLMVSLGIGDPTSGAVVVDTTPISVVDCSSSGNQPQAPQPGGTPAGFSIVLPDPDNAPLQYQRVDKNTPLEGPGQFAPVWQDQTGYYYMHNGQRVDLPNPP